MLKPLYDIDVLLPFVSANSIIVTPNERLARAISHAYDAFQADQGLEAWAKISVMSLNRVFERWLDEGRLAPCLKPQQAQYLWESIIRGRMPDDHVTGWLNPKALALESYKTYELIYHYQLRADQSFASAMAADPDSATFYEWLQSFEHDIIKHGWVTQAQQWQALASCHCKLAADVIMVDFDTLTPLQRAACERVSERVRFVRSVLPQSIDAAKTSVCAFQDADEQLRWVAAWAKAHYETKQGERLGIVVPDLNTHRQRLEYHLRQAFGLEHSDYTSLPVNFSAGMAASQVPLIDAAASVLKLSLGRLRPAELLALARSPYLSLCVSHHEFRALREALYDLAPAKLGHSELLLILEQLSKEVPDSALSRWLLTSRVDSKDATCLEHVRHWEQSLQAAGWPGKRGLDSVEYQAFKLWQRTLRDLVSWDGLRPKWAASDALTLLESSLANSVFQPETPDQNIQVLGTLEAAGLCFDRLIVTDAVAGHFPERIALSPFLPKHLQRQYKMPRADEDQEYQLAKSLLEGMAARSQSLYFSYVALADESKVAVTPLLSQLEQSFPVVAELDRPVIPGVWSMMLESRGLTLTTPQGDLKGGAYRLGMHALCPMQAYSRYRLDIPEEASLEDGLSAKEQGLVLHKSMELLWRGKNRLEQVNPADIAPAVAEALKSISRARQVLLPDLALEAEQLRLETAIRLWLELESQRVPFNVLEHERKAELNLKGWTFSFRLDRLDALADDHSVIIDYKSTAPSSSTWFGGRLEQAQLPLYALALGEHVKGIAYGQISSTKPAKLVGAGQQGFGKGVKVIENWGEQKALWERALLDLIDELEVGEASVLPSARACRYCDFAAICRVQLADDEEEGTDE